MGVTGPRHIDRVEHGELAVFDRRQVPECLAEKAEQVIVDVGLTDHEVEREASVIREARARAAQRLRRIYEVVQAHIGERGQPGH